MSITEQGMEGEKKARQILKNHNFKIFEADWIILDVHKKYYLVEVKHKQMFTKEYKGKITAPFDGHGLDNYQIRARQIFQEKTGIRTIFLVINIPDNKVYWNFLDVLWNGEKYHNKLSDCYVFPISNFLSEDKLWDLYWGKIK